MIEPKKKQRKVLLLVNLFSAANNDSARIIDGRSAAEEIKSSIAIDVSRMKESIGKVPGLAVILVGQRQDSLAYVRNKIMACHEVGFRFSIAELPESCTEEEVCDALSNYNKDASIHGILVQLPLPQVKLQLRNMGLFIFSKKINMGLFIFCERHTKA